MRSKQLPWWYLADSLCGMALGALWAFQYQLTALLIMEYYNPYHLRLTRGSYDLTYALVEMICFAPFGAATRLAVSGLADCRSAIRPLRRLRFLLLFIGPALAIPVLANWISIEAGEWELAAFIRPFLLPAWAIGLVRIMVGWQPTDDKRRRAI